MNFRYLPGLRTIKTVLAVMGCLLVAFLLGRGNAFYSCIAAVVCMLPTFEQTFKTGVNRVIGTIIGGIFGYLVIELCDYIPYYHEWAYLICIPLAMLLPMYICNIIGKKAAVSICCIVFLSIVANSSRDITHALSYVVDRVLDTTIGIVMAVIVNGSIKPRTEGKIGEEGNGEKVERE